MRPFSQYTVGLMIEDETLRNAVKVLIGDDRSFKIVWQGHGYHNFRLHRSGLDFLVMSLDETNSCRGLRAIFNLRRMHRRCQVLVLSECSVPEFIISTFKAGATAYLVKQGCVEAEILNQLNELSRGGMPLSLPVSRIVVESFRLKRHNLTRREAEVLSHLSKGKTCLEISEELIISKQTCKTHIKNIYSKLNVNCRSEAIAEIREKKYKPV